MPEFNLFEHNLKTYNAIKESFDSGENIASIIQATGTGKSYIALKLALDNFPKKMLFVAPTKSIIEHVQNLIVENNLEGKVNIEFTTYQKIAMSLTQEQFEEINYDYLVVDEFHHTGAPIWGSKIEELVKNHPNSKTLGMSAYSVRDKGSAYAFDVAPIIDNVDEIDELPIFTNSVVSRYTLADAISEGVLPNPKYITSTIKMLNYLDVISQKIKNCTATEFEKQKWFNEMSQIRANLLKFSDVKTLLTQNLTDKDKVIFFAAKGKIDGVRVIEDTVRELKSIFPDAEIYSTTSDDPDGKNKRDAFYNDVDLSGKNVSRKLRIMVTIDQYKEGVHAKGVNKVVMGRGTQSDIVFFEQLGRALSVTAEKQPVCIDLAGNIDFILSLSNEITMNQKEGRKTNIKRSVTDSTTIDNNFGIDQHLIDISNRFDEYFERLDNWEMRFEQLQNYLLEHSGRYPKASGKATKDEVDLTHWVQYQKYLNAKGKLLEERKNLLNSINFDWNCADDQYWNEKLQELEEFMSKNNRYPSSKEGKNNPQEMALYRWIRRQRVAEKNGTLSEDKKEKLDEVGFKWTPTWEKLLKQLLVFVDKNGSYPNKTNYKSDEELRLARWVESQRYVVNIGKMPEPRLKLLQECGFDFGVSFEQLQFSRDVEWNNKLNEFFIYVKKIGRYPSQYTDDKEEKKWARWVSLQRMEFNKGILKEDRLKLLKEVGFDFGDTVETRQQNNDKIWQEMLAKFCEFLRTEKRYPSHSTKDEQELALAKWIQKQRTNYKNGEIKEDRKQQLNSIDFIWDEKEMGWKNALDLLKAFLEEKRIYPRQGSNDSNEKFLGAWSRNQRVRLYSIKKEYESLSGSEKEKYAQEHSDQIKKIQMLDEISFVWNLTEKKEFFYKNEKGEFILLFSPRVNLANGKLKSPQNSEPAESGKE